MYSEGIKRLLKLYPNIEQRIEVDQKKLDLLNFQIKHFTELEGRFPDIDQQIVEHI